MSELPPFVGFPKIPRLKRHIFVTEKIDGTNAQVVVLEDGRVLAGSRNRWITPERDNFGFAGWVKAHEEELRTGLGIGQHFGEWWGPGIQRGYGIPAKRFSLFNATRWTDAVRPACCSVVPSMYVGPQSEEAVVECLRKLREEGSLAAPGFMKPEGIVVYHSAGGHYYKVMLENDDQPKGVACPE